MKKLKFILLIILIHFCHTSDCQSISVQDTVRVVFYNTENLYDPFNDSLTMDDDFLPTQPRAWGYGRFRKKIISISRALLAAGRWNPPALIGLCEIENRFVLNQLVRESPLQKFGYKVIHEDSPDPRGVDVALLYQPSRVSIVNHRVIRMINPMDSTFRTRDVLEATVVLSNCDTLHIFVNHWPSKYGGIASSLEKRKFVASRVRTVLDSLFDLNSMAKILMMGDFNDGPDQEVMLENLRARPVADTTSPSCLVNLMGNRRWKTGTHKFRGEWSVLDQFLVSKSLMSGKVSVSGTGATIFSAEFLLEEDDGFTGHRPFRTFAGPRYLGGFSDHLPIVLDLLVRH
ncbi:MAG: endonuclease [Bacteroidetes bacterium]|nr:endonuclease [Bacteroidota bacterium]